VLSIEWSKELGGNLLIGGGMEEDEDPISCAKREIQEETGYANVKFISQSETIHHHYFAHSKNKARNIDAIGLYFELENEDQNEQQLEEDEKNKFSVVWLSENEAGEKITDPLHQYVFKKFIRGEIYSGAGILTETGEFSGRYSKDAILAITKHVKGKLTDQYKLRDWVVSRQRYWGVPIPIIHCDDCGAVPVPEKDLPVVLPGIEDYKPTGDGSSPLAKATDWVNVKCPTCKKDARRETDTLDTFVDSSWYFLRYCDPKNTKKFADKKHLKQWMPVDMYSGGAEHTTMHLLYSRFFIKAINDLGLVEWKEPYTIRRNRSHILGMDGQKMSKSQGNVINPDEYVEKLGADTLRMYLAFLGPYDEVGSYPWNTDSILGIRRFLDRIWRMAGSLEEGDVSEDTKRLFAKTVKKVGNDIERLHFNTAISALMVLVNHLEKNVVNTSAFSTVLQLLAPFAPHMSEELWCNELGRSKSIHSESWPVYDERLIKDEQFELVVQVNGKVRAQIIVESDISETDAKDVALGSENVQKYLDGNEPKKVIYVAGKLVNIVV
jgi:leucyl-tRNA synthetase